MQVNTNEVVIKILQGSVVTQTKLGGLTRPISLHPPVANFLWCIRQSYCNNKQAYFFSGPPCISGWLDVSLVAEKLV